jgi:hypothetical protein
VCSEITKSSTINKSNAQHAILFEAISLILALDCSRDLLATSVNSLGRFLSVKVRGTAGAICVWRALCWRHASCMCVLVHLMMRLAPQAG